MSFVKGLVAVICMWASHINPAMCQQSIPMNAIQVWSYYESLPFKINEAGEGLSQDFVDLINQQNKFQFKLEIIPRVRLDYYLSQKYKGMVLFVNWQWMGKEAKQSYLWSTPLLHDRNEVISSVKSPVEYSGPNSLVGKSFAAIRGRKYTGLDKLLEQDKIHRQFVNNEGSALLLINSGRVQTTSMARILLIPHIQKHKLQGKIFVSDTPLFAFTRHIMTSKSLPKVHDFIQGVVIGLDQNPQWQAILKKHDLHGK
ncbi:MAG: transporter substrate-binding domain-containing protein [Bermanella sp.]